jgi:hypothetical protein
MIDYDEFNLYFMNLTKDNLKIFFKNINFDYIDSNKIEFHDPIYNLEDYKNFSIKLGIDKNKTFHIDYILIFLFLILKKLHDDSKEKNYELLKTLEIVFYDLFNKTYEDMIFDEKLIKKTEEITTFINDRDIPIEELILFYDVDNKIISYNIIKQQIDRRLNAG